MPRDAYIIRSEPVTVPQLVEAAAEVAPQLTMRSLYDGVAVQFVDAEFRSVLTVQVGRALSSGEEIRRLVPSAPPMAGPFWFAEAFIPWDDADIGVEILNAIGMKWGATVIIEDGT